MGLHISKVPYWVSSTDETSKERSNHRAVSTSVRVRAHPLLPVANCGALYGALSDVNVPPPFFVFVSAGFATS